MACVRSFLWLSMALCLATVGAAATFGEGTLQRYKGCCFLSILLRKQQLGEAVREWRRGELFSRTSPGGGGAKRRLGSETTCW